MRQPILPILAGVFLLTAGAAAAHDCWPGTWDERVHDTPYILEESCMDDGTHCEVRMLTPPGNSLADNPRHSYWYAPPHPPHHHYDARR